MAGAHARPPRGAGWLVLAAPSGQLRTLAVAGAVLLAAAVALTAFGAAPIHGRLTGGFDVDHHRRLLRIDAVRTACWTARGLVAGALVWQSIT